MKDIERTDDRWIGLQELPGEALKSVPRHEQIETVTDDRPVVREKRPQPEPKKRKHRQRLVELHRVARNAVAEIHRPWHVCRESIGVIQRSGKKAAQPPERDADRQ